MSTLRIAIRLPLVALLTVTCYLAVLAARLLRRLTPRAALRLRNGAFRAWTRGFARLSGMRMTCIGKPPTGRFLLVANHLGYLDILLLGAHIDAGFIAKSELRSWPLAGAIIAAGDTVFVDRGRKRDLLRVLDEASDMAYDIGVVLFPEGTSGDGSALLPFKPSLLELAVRQRHPVHFATLTYRAPPPHAARDRLCWWGDASFGPHLLRLLGLPGFDAKVRFGDRPIDAVDRKQLAADLRRAMDAQFIPVE